MARLFIDKKVEINAPPAMVWDVLTKSEYTNQWAKEFWWNMTVVSDWKLGSPVLWKNPEWKVEVEGNVTMVNPWVFLRFTVFDVSTWRIEVSDDDGITFELEDRGDKTLLHLTHGDFSVMDEGQKFYDMTLESWESVLPKIKELSEM
ncbi:MAG: hypothetical protein ACD_2C00071G0003 [uncultured bacterium (gcode 4)]|uniref:Activator of Hsp90 ATPase homologue 1/2-like C-terminal domain-containing protein n=1 Tax=uncultured bacterium (gcode 4) TaxID=1234023 RepID=K2GHM8_9BACT|nr:MAG: hypothetical protein ACD_2C00071G0003 [uncultured bacterium (gcode 4)]